MATSVHPGPDGKIQERLQWEEQGRRVVKVLYKDDPYKLRLDVDGMSPGGGIVPDVLSELVEGPEHNALDTLLAVRRQFKKNYDAQIKSLDEEIAILVDGIVERARVEFST